MIVSPERSVMADVVSRNSEANWGDEGGMTPRVAVSQDDPRARLKGSEIAFVNRIEATAKLVIAGEGATPRRIVEPKMMATIVFGKRDPDLVGRVVELVELGVKAMRTGKDARDIFDQIAAQVVHRPHPGGNGKGS